jgi:hypothetical protein
LNFTVDGISDNSSSLSVGSTSNSFNLTFGGSVGIGISKNFETGKKK